MSFEATGWRKTTRTYWWPRIFVARKDQREFPGNEYAVGFRYLLCGTSGHLLDRSPWLEDVFTGGISRGCQRMGFLFWSAV